MLDDDTPYIAAPGSKSGVAHLKRPDDRYGKGSPMALLIRSSRGPQTFCGRPITDEWKPVAAVGFRPCGTCLKGEFAEDDD